MDESDSDDELEAADLAEFEGLIESEVVGLDFVPAELGLDEPLEGFNDGAELGLDADELSPLALEAVDLAELAELLGLLLGIDPAELGLADFEAEELGADEALEPELDLLDLDEVLDGFNDEAELGLGTIDDPLALPDSLLLLDGFTKLELEALDLVELGAPLDLAEFEAEALDFDEFDLVDVPEGLDDVDEFDFDVTDEPLALSEPLRALDELDLAELGVLLDLLLGFEAGTELDGFGELLFGVLGFDDEAELDGFTELPFD